MNDEPNEVVNEIETVIDDNKQDTKNVKTKSDECLELKNIKYKTMLMNGSTMAETKTSSDMDNLEKFLETEMSQNKSEPWCKLDKTMKTRKLLVFVELYKEKHDLTTDETDILIRFLKDCLSKKRLSRVKDVTYDKETGVVKDIPALLFNKSTKHFTLKNTEKRVSTLKSLPTKKISITKTSKKKDSIRSIDSIENLDD
jgi:hypothetical protein